MALITNLPLSGPNGSTSITDTTGNFSWAAFGNAQIQSNALLLDGADDYILANIDDRLLIGTKDFRISVDVRWNTAVAPGPWRVIIDQLNLTLPAGHWAWQVMLGSGGVIQWNLYSSGGSNPALLQGPNVTDGNWHTVVIERINSITRMYVDGALIGSVSDDRYYARLSTMPIGSRKGPAATNIYDWAGSIRNVSIEVIEPPLPTNVITRSYFRIQPIGWAGRWRNGFFKAAQSGAAFPGTPVQVRSRGKMCITRGVPPWYGRPDSTTQLPTYKIRGRVMQRDPDTGIDTPLSLVRVALFFRRLHTLVDIQRSDDDGYVQFDNLMPGPQGYYAVAFDPEGAPLQNAVIYDRLSSEPGP